MQHPRTAVIGSRSGRAGFLCLLASPIRGWLPQDLLPQDFLPEYRWGTSLLVGPLDHPQAYLSFGYCKIPQPTSQAPPHRANPALGPALPFPVPGRARRPAGSRPVPGVGEFWVCVWKRRRPDRHRGFTIGKVTCITTDSSTELPREYPVSPGREDVASVH